MHLCLYSISAIVKQNRAILAERGENRTFNKSVCKKIALVAKCFLDVAQNSSNLELNKFGDAIACAACSKPTLCEKPLAPTVSGIVKMLEAFQKQSVPLFVGQSLRFKFCVQKAKQLLQSGRLGQLLSIRTHFSVPVPKENWRHQKAQGGGVLQDIGVHLIDLIRFISGEEIQSISATANHDYQNTALEVDQTVAAICRLTDQTLASFEQ